MKKKKEFQMKESFYGDEGGIVKSEVELWIVDVSCVKRKRTKYSEGVSGARWSKREIELRLTKAPSNLNLGLNIFAAFLWNIRFKEHRWEYRAMMKGCCFFAIRIYANAI